MRIGLLMKWSGWNRIPIACLMMSPTRHPVQRRWFAGRAAVRGFFKWAWGPAGPGPFRLLHTSANGQPAFGLYGRSPDGEGYTPQAIHVLTLDGFRIARLHGFVRPNLFEAFSLPARL